MILPSSHPPPPPPTQQPTHPSLYFSTSPRQARYAVEEVRYVDELAEALEELAPPCLHVLDGGVNTDRRGGGPGRRGQQGRGTGPKAGRDDTGVLGIGCCA